MEEANSLELCAGLLEGRLDVALIRPSASDPGELQVRELLDEPLIVALPEDHPAASSPEPIALEALRSAPMILTPRAVAVGLHDAALAACQAAGFAPVLGQPAPYIASILSLISAGLGVSLVPEGMRRVAVEGVRYRDIRPPVPRVSLALATRSQRPPRLAANFATLARAIARQTAAGP